MKNMILYIVTESVRGILDMVSYLLQTVALPYMEEPYFVVAPFISRACSSDAWKWATSFSPATPEGDTIPRDR